MLEHVEQVVLGRDGVIAAMVLGNSPGDARTEAALAKVGVKVDAATVAKDGYSKRQVKQFLFEHARVPLGRMAQPEDFGRAILFVASLPARTMAHKLLAEHEMGELFKVIALGAQGLDLDPIGFTEGDRTHRL